MFANTWLGVMNLGFPDVCLTPPLAIPVPYPNITFSFFHIPSLFDILIGGGFAENLLTQGTVSLGDFTGVLLGVASGMMAGPDRPILGSFKVIHGAAFATHLTTLNIQNSTNTIGITLTPAQIRVVILS